jgi:hypothetical protein
VLSGSQRGSSLYPSVLLKALEGVMIVALLELTPEAVAETLRDVLFGVQGRARRVRSHR